MWEVELSGWDRAAVRSVFTARRITGRVFFFFSSREKRATSKNQNPFLVREELALLSAQKTHWWPKSLALGVKEAASQLSSFFMLTAVCNGSKR